MVIPSGRLPLKLRDGTGLEHIGHVYLTKTRRMILFRTTYPEIRMTDVGLNHLYRSLTRNRRDYHGTIPFVENPMINYLI